MFSVNSRPSEAGESKPEQRPRESFRAQTVFLEFPEPSLKDQCCGTGIGFCNVHVTVARAPASLMRSKGRWEIGRRAFLRHCDCPDNGIVMNWPQATAKRPHVMVVNESEKLNVLAAKIEPLSCLCVAPKPDKTEA